MMADEKQIKLLLNTAKGQIEGIIKMIDEGAYCIDISNQLLAASAILRKANVEILDAHLHHCVLHSSESEKAKKLEEISEVLKKVMK